MRLDEPFIVIPDAEGLGIGDRSVLCERVEDSVRREGHMMDIERSLSDQKLSKVTQCHFRDQTKGTHSCRGVLCQDKQLAAIEESNVKNIRSRM